MNPKVTKRLDTHKTIAFGEPCLRSAEYKQVCTLRSLA